MSYKLFRLFASLTLVLVITVITSGVRSALAQQSSALTLGMVADLTNTVTVFDVGTDTVLGTVSIPVSGDPDEIATGDVLITPDQTLGFVTDFNSEVFVIDLTTVPPSLAGGANPIPISNFGEDLSISPDGKFLVVSDGSATQPISVIDIATRAEISTLSVGSDTNSVDVCSDASVLVTSFNDNTVRRLTISGTGTLTDTGEVLTLGEPNNVFCAPGGTTGIVITRGTNEIQSFTIPGLGLVETRGLSGNFGISGLINLAGDRVFTRDNGGFVDAFSYNSTTGALGAAPIYSISIADTIPFFGMDQMALTPDGNKLYVTQPNALNVYDAGTGALMTTISDPNIVIPTGVFVSGPAQMNVTLDIRPGSQTNPINTRSLGTIPVAILSTLDFDALSEVDRASLTFGRTGDEHSLAFCNKNGEDVNGDGLLDLVCHFKTNLTGFQMGDTVGTLKGQTVNGVSIEGQDTVRILK